jgi:hypothetical protein
MHKGGGVEVGSKAARLSPLNARAYVDARRYVFPNPPGIICALG